ncbi:MAG: ABC transporter permease [Cyanobacteriota bacterium]|nr:ABC transporter permease [Cyanobacteriota bacterium]
MSHGLLAPLTRYRWLYLPLVWLGLALLLIGGLIVLVGANPVTVLGSLLRGAVGTPDQVGRVIATLAPLLLCCSGLVYTFAAGLYNLGIEGQITLGAVAATGALRLLPTSLPAEWLVGLALLAGVGGGILWGGLAAALHIYGRISEIFAGLGLNFVGQGLVLYLIFGPWQRQGIASMSGTELIDPAVRLSTWGQTEASPLALALGILALLVTMAVLRTTYLGLELRAIGQNPRAAFVLGIPATERLFSAFYLCGGLAGLAGAMQVLAVFHRLIPNISSNLGFLGLLVVMLVGFNPLFVLPVAIFFSVLNVGSLQLPLALQLESSLAGVIQGTLVLLVLLSRGWAERRTR